MRWVPSLVIMVGALALLGSDCSQELFPPLPCENNAECEAECEVFCASGGEEVMSAECDANGFCDCLCMEGGTGGSGGMGTGGTGGVGTGGSGGSMGDCVPTQPCEVGVFGDMACFALCESSSGCTIDFCDIESPPACVGGYCVYQCTDGRQSCDP
jgi:hypothetical protein